MSDEEALELARSGMKPIDIAASLGIEVQFLPFKSVKGIAMSLDSQKLIMIDKGLTEIEQQLVCGHELGHFLFHGESNFMFILEKTYFYPKQEYKANLFACELVLGEKAALYQAQIKEAASSHNLKSMAEVISYLVGDEE